MKLNYPFSLTPPLRWATMQKEKGNYNAEIKLGSRQQGLMRYPITTKSLWNGEIEKIQWEKLYSKKRWKKDAQMKHLKRISQDHKYNESLHDRSLRLRSSPRMAKLLCRWTYLCDSNLKETKVVDKDDKTHVCKVQLEVLVDAQRRKHENPEIKSPIKVG